MFGRLGASLRLYRSHKLGLMLVAVTALAVHLLIGVAVYFAARGLFDTVPTLGEHLVISPLSSVAGALPVAPAGLGQYEVAMNYLFEKLPVSAMPKGMGFLVALWYRAATIFVAAIGIVFYWVHRREVRRVWQQAKQRDFLDA